MTAGKARQVADEPDAPREVIELLSQRSVARAARDWETADALRDQIRERGWEVNDGPPRSAHGPAGGSTGISTLRPLLPAAAADTGYASAETLESLLDQQPTADATLHLVAEDHPSDLRRFARGLAAHPPTGSWELVAVANAASFDVAAEIPHPIRPRVTLLPTSHRLGWADAVNLGMRRGRGAVAILVDTSVEPTGDFLTPVRAAFDADPRLGVAGAWGLTSDNGRQFEEAEPGEVDAVEAYFLAVRREVLRDVGLFDPHFRFHRNADLDFNFAARAAGWRAVRLADLPLVRHVHRGYHALPAAERDRLSKRNFYRFLKRWGDRRDLLLRPAAPHAPHRH